VSGATNLASSADAQGLFDQFILPMLLQRFLSGGGGGGGTTRLSLNDTDIKKISDSIFSQSGLKDVSLKLENIEKIVRAHAKSAGVKVPDAVPPISMSIPASSPATEELRAEFRTLVDQIEAKQASTKAASVASPNKTERLRAEFQSLVAEIEAKQTVKRKAESPNSPVVAGAK
jgi:hypothetical protein